MPCHDITVTRHDVIITCDDVAVTCDDVRETRHDVRNNTSRRVLSARAQAVVNMQMRPIIGAKHSGTAAARCTTGKMAISAAVCWSTGSQIELVASEIRISAAACHSQRGWPHAARLITRLGARQPAYSRQSEARAARNEAAYVRKRGCAR